MLLHAIERIQIKENIIVDYNFRDIHMNSRCQFEPHSHISLQTGF